VSVASTEIVVQVRLKIVVSLLALEEVRLKKR